MFCIYRCYCIKPLCFICITWNRYAVWCVFLSSVTWRSMFHPLITFLGSRKGELSSFFFFLPDVTNPESPKNIVELSVVNGGLTSQRKENGLNAVQQVPAQRKKLLKAPTLAELDSSDSEVSSPEVWVHKS